jgi:hypothetical protein
VGVSTERLKARSDTAIFFALVPGGVAVPFAGDAPDHIRAEAAPRDMGEPSEGEYENT